jgi:hypothetical protein
VRSAYNISIRSNPVEIYFKDLDCVTMGTNKREIFKIRLINISDSLFFFYSVAANRRMLQNDTPCQSKISRRGRIGDSAAL